MVEDEFSIRELLNALVKKLGCRGEVATGGQEALAMIRRSDFDAVLLDLRCPDLPAEDVVSGIHRLRPSLVGRVLVITGDVADLNTLVLVERHFLLQIPRSRLLQDLMGRLQALLGIRPSARRIES